MNNAFKALTLIGALVLLVSVLVAQGKPVSGAFDGIVRLHAGAATTTAEITFATNDTTTEASVIGVHVIDGDLLGAGGTPATATISSAGETVDVTLTFKDTSPTSTYTGGFRLNDDFTVASGVTTTLFSRSTPSTTTPPAAVTGLDYGTTTLVGGVLKDIFTTTLAWLKTAHGETVTASYTDSTATTGGSVTVTDDLKVDGEPPQITNVSPTDGTITDDKTPGYSADVRDEDSGVDETANSITTKLTNVVLLIGTGANASSSAAASSFGPLAADVTDIEEDDTKVGISISMNLDFVSPAAGGVVWIGVRVQDVAGNVATFDVDEDTSKDLHKVTIDGTAPTLDEVFTGVGWDATDGAFTKNGKDKILVIFDDTLTNLDSDTVETGDFQVTGPSRTVTAAEVFDADTVTTSVTGLTAMTWGTIRRSVFLTLSTDLEPGDTPNVKIIGSGVDDEAGNNQDDANKDAKDRIAPSITVSEPSPLLLSKDEKVTFTITADEELEKTPTIQITNLIGGAIDTLGNDTPVEKTTGKVWDVTTKAVAVAGTYSVYVTGQDGEKNAATAGLSGSTSTLVGEDDLIEFEVDIALQSPLVDPADEGEPTTRDPFFVTLDFTESTGAIAEDAEYAGDSYTTITITKAELDGVDVISDVSTDDDQLFLLAISGITSAEHTVTINAEDEAGNSLADDLEFTFTVEDRSAFELKLRPGWNLVSLPSDPEDGDINTVFADLPGVGDVVTYDPTVPGGTLSAVRDETGSLVGTLETITASRGYWINSKKFKTLSVALTTLAAGQVSILPPSIPIVKGWNLIPVVDITGQLAADADVAGASYLASVLADISRVYHFDTILNQWVNVPDFATAGTDNLKVGKAYFVYATDKGVLVP